MHFAIRQRNYDLRKINELVNFVQSHHFEEGIFLVKRRSVYFLGKEHYGFAVTGKYLRYYDSSWNTPKVIHKTNLGVHADDFEPFGWEKVEKMPEEAIIQAVFRTRISLYDAYHLLLDNCEHFARFVTTGKKVSLQVQNGIALGVIGLVIYLASRDDH